MALIQKFESNVVSLLLGRDSAYEITDNKGSIRVGNNCTLMINFNSGTLTIGKRCIIIECEHNTGKIVTGPETTIESVKFNSGILEIGPKSNLKSFESNLTGGVIKIGAHSKIPYVCTLPGSVAKIGRYCFYEQDGLPVPVSTRGGGQTTPPTAHSSTIMTASARRQYATRSATAATSGQTPAPPQMSTAPIKPSLSASAGNAAIPSSSGTPRRPRLRCQTIRSTSTTTQNSVAFASVNISTPKRARGRPRLGATSAVTGTGTVVSSPPVAPTLHGEPVVPSPPVAPTPHSQPAPAAPSVVTPRGGEPAPAAPSVVTPGDGENICVICMEKKRNMAFLCGHTCCDDCAGQLFTCHICRSPIQHKIKLYE